MEDFATFNKKLVLVVDDEEINRELLGNILHEKYRVEYACDGEEAIRMNLKKAGSKAAYAYFNILNMKAYNSHYNFSEGDKLLYSATGN